MGRLKRAAFCGLMVALVAGAGACHRHTHSEPDVTESQAPDKILYERAREDIKNKRYEVARITLQTLINTYPNSDYLADAKLAIADSYYEEGGVGPLTHAEIEYKDFITFFPNSPHVPRAQYRAAMSHFRQLQKPDRDPTHARRAEREFQLLLSNYPDSEYAEEAERKLIQVQEVLAEGQFRVAEFYYIKGTWRAVASRLVGLVERYPNYSNRDEALWMLGDVFQRNIPILWPGDPERAAEYLARLIREHPVSEYVPEAKKELKKLGHPVPQPHPELLARQRNIVPIGEREEIQRQKGFTDRGLLGWMFGMFKGRPDMSQAAAYLGPPPLEHDEDIPEIPPPTMNIKPKHTEVAVQTVQDVPAGEGGESQGQEVARNVPEEKEKKSFWRKLIPFY